MKLTKSEYVMEVLPAVASAIIWRHVSKSCSLYASFKLSGVMILSTTLSTRARGMVSKSELFPVPGVTGVTGVAGVAGVNGFVDIPGEAGGAWHRRLNASLMWASCASDVLR